MTPLHFLLLLGLCTVAKSPHIVFIMVDDSGWGNYGYHNNETNGEIQTPNIDSLATNGLILDRHYVHYVCSPTRSSFQSGRLPVHCNLNNAAAANNIYNGVPINYTCLATKLKQAKYSTHFVGKWDAGMTVKEQTPHGRGYDTSIGYLQHTNSYWNETAGPCNKTVDLWNTTQPAFGVNSTIYEEFIFANAVYDVINNHDASTPLLLVYTPHIGHTPLQVPKYYYIPFDNDETLCGQNHGKVYPGFNTSIENYHCRSIYQAMINLLDIIVGNITTLLKTNALWDETLLVFTGDNGGPENNASGANNFPLRGGKFVPFEGGVRTASFVSGGFLPNDRRGQVENGMMHVADWYATFCALNGIDPTDTRAAKAGLPPIDSLNVWDMITGTNSTSPRYEVPIDDNAFIQGNYKLINGTSVGYASWGGVLYPNASTPQSPIHTVKLDCKTTPCLFDVVTDITEHNNIATEQTDIVQQMMIRFEQVKKGYYTNNEKGVKDLCPSNINSSDCVCWMASNTYQGYYGPYQTL